MHIQYSTDRPCNATSCESSGNVHYLHTKVLCTLVKSTAVLYSPEFGRWLSGNELLTAQGFPVRSNLSYNKAACSFAQDSLRRCHCKTTHVSVAGQAGNSMHTGSVAVALLFALLSQPQPESTDIQPNSFSSCISRLLFSKRLLRPTRTSAD
jgi:hypothetical protein